MKLGTGETLAFALRWLPQNASVLEVGCGDGELAAELQRLGFVVTAVDSDAAMVDQARSRGIDARRATWPDEVAEGRMRGLTGATTRAPYPERFDGILFTRSLHHISPLDEAVAAVKRASGMILIEDFTLNEVSESFKVWLRSLKEDWEPHDVHPFAAIRREVEKHFSIAHEERAPYCYRYFDPPLDRSIYAEEIVRGEMLGRRIVGVA